MFFILKHLNTKWKLYNFIYNYIILFIIINKIKQKEIIY